MAQGHVDHDRKRPALAARGALGPRCSGPGSPGGCPAAPHRRSPERAELLRAALGAGWRERFGDAYDEWSLRRFHEHARRPRRPLHGTPEHLSLDALITAWRAGLTSIVTIPCRGEYTRVISGTTLLMTETTREHPERYSTALMSFG